MSGTEARRHDALPWVLTSTFTLAGLLLSARHEMWRDEMGAWLTVRDSSSLGGLLANLEYGGHPALWYVCLKVLHLVFGSPWAMQVFSVAVAAGAVFVMARWSPFSVTQKILLASGYFVFYEYAVVARNYGLGMLLGFVLCALYPLRRERWLWVGAVLFLLAQTNALGVMLVLAFLPVLVIDGRHARSPSWWGSVALAVAGIVGAGVVISPPADSGFAVEWYFRLDADRWTQVGHAFRNALAPLPPLGLSSWGRNVMDEPSWRPLANFFAFSVIACSAVAFLRRPRVLWFFLLGTIGIAALLYLKLDGSFRHHGYLFLVLVMAQWLHSEGSDAQDAPVSATVFDRPARVLFTTVLFIHLIGALSIGFSDWRHPFSMARATAEYLREEGLNAEPIVAYRDAAAAGVLGYAGIRSAYFLQGAREGSFVVWDSARAVVISPRDVACGAIMHSARIGRPVLLLANRPLAPGWHGGSFASLARFDGAIVPDENFSLTRVDAARGSGREWCATRR